LAVILEQENISTVEKRLMTAVREAAILLSELCITSSTYGVHNLKKLNLL